MKVNVVGLLAVSGLFLLGCGPSTQEALRSSALGGSERYQGEDAGLRVVVSFRQNGLKPGEEATVTVTLTNLTDEDLRVLPVPLCPRNSHQLADVNEGWTCLYLANHFGSPSTLWSSCGSHTFRAERGMNMLQCWHTLDTGKTASHQKKVYLSRLREERARWNMNVPFYVLPPKASLSKTAQVIVDTPQWDFGIFSLPEFYTVQQEKKSGETSSSYRPPKIWTGSIYLRETW